MKTTHSQTSVAQTSVGGRNVGDFSIRWVKVAKPAKKKDSLRAIYSRLLADPDRLEQIAEANTRRLTGQASF